MPCHNGKRLYRFVSESIPEREFSELFSATLLKRRGKQSQADFARFLGIDHQETYSRYESGRIPKGEILYQLANKLGISMEELLTGRAPEKTPEGATLVIGENVLPDRWDVSGPTEKLEAELAETGKAVPGSVRPVKKALIGYVFQLVLELRKRYVQEDEHWRQHRAEQYSKDHLPSERSKPKAIP